MLAGIKTTWKPNTELSLCASLWLAVNQDEMRVSGKTNQPMKKTLHTMTEQKQNKKMKK